VRRRTLLAVPHSARLGVSACGGEVTGTAATIGRLSEVSRRASRTSPIGFETVRETLADGKDDTVIKHNIRQHVPV
jgi:hypothetical protein